MNTPDLPLKELSPNFAAGNPKNKFDQDIKYISFIKFCSVV